jgi:hypothetical protein
MCERPNFHEIDTFFPFKLIKKILDVIDRPTVGSKATVLHNHRFRVAHHVGECRLAATGCRVRSRT